MEQYRFENKQQHMTAFNLNLLHSHKKDKNKKRQHNMSLLLFQTYISHLSLKHKQMNSPFKPNIFLYIYVKNGFACNQKSK